VQAMQSRVIRDVGALDAGVSTCLAALDADGTLAKWHQQKNIALGWAGADPGALSGKRADYWDQGRALESVLRLNWWPRLAAAGCNVGPAPDAPAPPNMSTDNPQSWLSNVFEGGQLLLVLGVFLLARELKR